MTTVRDGLGFESISYHMSKKQDGVKLTRKATGGIVMSTPKIAALLGVAGMLGVIVSVMLGKLSGADYLLDAAFVCLVLAGVIMILHVAIGLWTDFTRSA
jgi:hypothetical protein